MQRVTSVSWTPRDSTSSAAHAQDTVFLAVPWGRGTKGPYCPAFLPHRTTSTPVDRNRPRWHTGERRARRLEAHDVWGKLTGPTAGTASASRRVP
ncbi:hypothetical protein ElyMa_002659600 [Elysia marginata]|uniref:Uncharacterized protein n=1 Tax=Elysia marginata TaxID=1093978 RepID=A0AAV4H746_9GAST|nr:hypothetical protein ElyMa_002659600 [Elysia marginata]